MNRLRRSQFALLCALCLSATPTWAFVIGGPVTNPANGHHYVLLSADTWTGSEAQAVALGGHLATVNNAAENIWITNTFSAALFGGSTFYLWIGLNDIATEGVYAWSSGEPVTYLNWYPGEPNNAGGAEDYVQIYNFPEGQQRWNDSANINGYNANGNRYTFNGIVEIVPEPGTISLLLLGLGGALIVRRPRRRESA